MTAKKGKEKRKRTCTNFVQLLPIVWGELYWSTLHSQLSSDIFASELFAGLAIGQLSDQQLVYIQFLEVVVAAGHIFAAAVAAVAAGHISAAAVAALCIFAAAVAASAPSKSAH